jgi:hypothetical protein
MPSMGITAFGAGETVLWVCVASPEAGLIFEAVVPFAGAFFAAGSFFAAGIFDADLAGIGMVIPGIDSC